MLQKCKTYYLAPKSQTSDFQQQSGKENVHSETQRVCKRAIHYTIKEQLLRDCLKEEPSGKSDMT